VITVVFLM